MKIRASVDDVRSIKPNGVKPKPEQDPSSSGDKYIIVYGRDSCGWCSRIKDAYDREGWTYRFVNCDSEAGNREMGGFLRENNHQGSVGLPVCNIDGVMKIRASVNDVNEIRAGRGGKPARQRPSPTKPTTPSNPS
jgi:glutaredoxin